MNLAQTLGIASVLVFSTTAGAQPVKTTLAGEAARLLTQSLKIAGVAGKTVGKSTVFAVVDLTCTLTDAIATVETDAMDVITCHVGSAKPMPAAESAVLYHAIDAALGGKMQYHMPHAENTHDKVVPSLTCTRAAGTKTSLPDDRFSCAATL